MRPANVRLARPDEGDAIYQLLLGLYEESGIFTIDPVKTRLSIEELLDPSQGLVGLIDGPDGLEGSVGLGIVSAWYSSDPYLTEVWNYVAPECRRSSHAKSLLEFAKWASDELSSGGVQTPVQMGIVSTSRTAAKERLYRRQLEHVGSYFMHGRKNLKTEAA